MKGDKELEPSDRAIYVGQKAQEHKTPIMNKLELINKETTTIIRKEEDGDILIIQTYKEGFTKQTIISIDKENISKLIQFLN